MNHRVCRWGILSTANIARKNWAGIRNSENGIVTAVASRSVDKAQQFIDQCQAHTSFDVKPVALGSYEDLLDRPDVDAIYLPLPTGLRKEWIIRAARAGKHVLLEKPAGCNTDEVLEMITECRKQNVQFMDGVMFMHSQRLPKLRATFDDGQSIGQMRRITSQFSFRGSGDFATSNIRTSEDLEPLGCLGDLGWYNVRFSLWAKDFQMPHSVSGRMLSQIRRPGSQTAVPTEFSGELFFSDGTTASFYCSFDVGSQIWANISGTAGYIHIRDFSVGFYGNELSFTVTNAVLNKRGCDFNLEDHTRKVTVPEYSAGWPNSQEANMFRNFSHLVLSGKTDPYWPDIALKTQRVVDACLASARDHGRLVEL